MYTSKIFLSIFLLLPLSIHSMEKSGKKPLLPFLNAILKISREQNTKDVTYYADLKTGEQIIARKLSDGNVECCISSQEEQAAWFGLCDAELQADYFPALEKLFKQQTEKIVMLAEHVSS